MFQDISNADFWQIAGIVALEKANPKLSLTFKGGRQDCPRSPEDDADHGYPNPVMNHTEMIDYFRGTDFGFNMTEQQVPIPIYTLNLPKLFVRSTPFRTISYIIPFFIL